MGIVGTREGSVPSLGLSQVLLKQIGEIEGEIDIVGWCMCRNNNRANFIFGDVFKVKVNLDKFEQVIVGKFDP